MKLETKPSRANFFIFLFTNVMPLVYSFTRLLSGWETMRKVAGAYSGSTRPFT